MNPNKYYIIDFRDIRSPILYKTGFLFEDQAKGVVKSFLKTPYLTVMKGDLVSHFSFKSIKRLKLLKSKVPLFELTTKQKKRTYFHRKGRNLLKGKKGGLYLFEDIWEPDYSRGYERRKKRVKGRDSLRVILLKSTGKTLRNDF